MTAKYKHDCTECIFLGQFEWTNESGTPENVVHCSPYRGIVGRSFCDKTIYDLYFCEDGGMMGSTVIARYGNEGHEYMSGMRFANDKEILPLYEAKQRAINQGLLKE